MYNITTPDSCQEFFSPLQTLRFFRRRRPGLHADPRAGIQPGIGAKTRKLRQDYVRITSGLRQGFVKLRQNYLKLRRLRQNHVGRRSGFQAKPPSIRRFLRSGTRDSIIPDKNRPVSIRSMIMSRNTCPNVHLFGNLEVDFRPIFRISGGSSW